MSEIRGTGLGLKRELISRIQAEFGRNLTATIDFLEIVPESRIGAEVTWVNSSRGSPSVIRLLAMVGP